MVEMARFIKPILGIVPPDPAGRDPRQLTPLNGLLRTFQQLPEKQQAVFVQLMTMSATDFLRQWFETDPLIATMSASGIIGTFQGVQSPGTAYVLLHHYMGEIDGAFRAWGIPRGGTGGISNAIASSARALGRRDPDRGAGGQDPRPRRPRRRRRPRERRGDLGDERAQLGRRAADLPRAGRAGQPRPGVRGRGPPVQVPRLVGQGQPGRRPAARVHLPARRGRPPPRRDQLQRRRRRHGAAPTTTRSTATGRSGRTST